MSAEYDEITNSVKLCWGGKKCPVVSLEDDKVRIDDDYGNHVLLDHGQANLLKEALILVRAKG